MYCESLISTSKYLSNYIDKAGVVQVPGISVRVIVVAAYKSEASESLTSSSDFGVLWI